MMEKILAWYLAVLETLLLFAITLFALFGPLILGLYVKPECFLLYIGSFVMSPLILLMWTEWPEVISDLKEDM